MGSTGADEFTACEGFINALAAAPHLLRMIRSIRVSMVDKIVRQLRKVKFPNLQILVLHDEATRFPGRKASQYVGKIICRRLSWQQTTTSKAIKATEKLFRGSILACIGP
jgi:hypothetical protein